MHYRKSVIAIVVLMISAASFGQEEEFKGSDKVDIKWGAEQKASRTATLSDIIGFDENGIYAIKTRGGMNWGVNMEHYDYNYESVSSVKFDVEMNDRNMDLEMMVHLDEELYLFTSYRDGKAKKNSLFYQTVDKGSMNPKGTPQEIATIDYSGHTKWNSGVFNYDLSRDSSKVLIYYDMPYESGEAEKFGLRVFDKDLNELWSRDITLPYNDKLFQVVDYIVDNAGNVYLVGKLYREGVKNKVRGEANYTYQLLSYSGDGESMEEYEIKLKDRFIMDLKVAITDDLDIICGGFYSEHGKYSIKGSYFMKIDGESWEIAHESTQDFEIDFITQNMTEREEEKAKKKEEKGKNVELYEYDLDNIVIREDGGVILVGEQFFIRVTHSTTYSNGVASTTTHYHYYYNDIIAINISPEGEIEWTQKIAKRQHTVDDGGFFSSYAMAQVDDKLYFFFNDNPKNLGYTGSGKVERMNGKKSVVTMVELDSEGNQERESLFSYKDAEVMCRPKVSEQIDDRVMVLFGQKGKTQRFIEVNFK